MIIFWARKTLIQLILSGRLVKADNRRINGQKWYLFGWDFNTHITTSDHDTIRSSDDFVNLSDTFVIFDFRNDFDAGTIITKSVTD